MLGFGENYSLQLTGTLLAKRIHRRSVTRQKSNTMKNMSTLVTKGNWNIAKGRLKQKFARLTQDDLQFIEGMEDELVGRIQKRTGLSRKNIRRTSDEGYGCHIK
jgi:uncharacterized protein YjbJ (UPF0337 family)